MKKRLVICGDSFNVGIGCRDLLNEPYGQLLSKHLDMPIKNLAKGSSTNLSIFLQAKYVADNWADSTEICLVSHTSYDRVEWFPLDYQTSQKHNVTNLDVNYHEYPPYGPGTYTFHHLPSPMADEPGYRGGMFTENISGVVTYVESVLSKKHPRGDYFKKFAHEPDERLRTLYDYGAQILDSRLLRIQSHGLMTMAHTMLRKKNIKHLILTHEVQEYARYIDPENLVYVHWGELAHQYPDDLPSLHTSKQGHQVAYAQVLEKLKQNGWV